MKPPKRPRDPNQLAKMIVDIATGEIEDAPAPDPKTKGRAGGLKGGIARAKTLDPQTRRRIAQKAAAGRWGKKQP
jgi:hypothetical protein